MRLNLGSDGRLAGWICVDLYHRCDVRADIVDLPFRDRSARRVNVSHVLEHLLPLEAVFALIEIRRVLTPDGIALLRGPDCHADRVPDVALHGQPERLGMAHHWECSLPALRAMADRARLTVRASDGHGWPAPTWYWPETILEATR